MTSSSRLNSEAWGAMMTVDTKKVTQRREVRYDSYDDLLSDAEHLASGDVQTVGNWTLGQIFQHLAKTLNSSIDVYATVE